MLVAAERDAAQRPESEAFWSAGAAELAAPICSEEGAEGAEGA